MYAERGLTGGFGRCAGCDSWFSAMVERAGCVLAMVWAATMPFSMWTGELRDRGWDKSVVSCDPTPGVAWAPSDANNTACADELLASDAASTNWLSPGTTTYCCGHDPLITEPFPTEAGKITICGAVVGGIAPIACNNWSCEAASDDANNAWKDCAKFADDSLV